MSEDEDAEPKPAGTAPAANPLIEPTLVGRMGRDIASGKLTPKGMSELLPGSQWELVPEVLRAFVASQNLSDLADALGARPILYWHPIVAIQMRHLHKVACQWDFEDDHATIAAARRELERLLGVHAESLSSGRRMRWDDKPKKRGPKSDIANPHPSGAPGSEIIRPSQLFSTWKAVWAVFSAAQDRLSQRPDEHNDGLYRKRLAALVPTLLSRSPIEWSSLWSFVEEPAQALNEEEDSSPYDVRLSALEREVSWHVDFGPPTKAALDSRLREDDGLPAALASCVLGHLLGIPGEQVFHVVEHYRRKK